MHALRAASHAPAPTLTPAPALAGSHLSVVRAAPAPCAVQGAGAVNPFASLASERTIEAQVSSQLLTLTRGGIAMGGATQSYQVSEELMALARKMAERHSSMPPTLGRAAAVQPSAPQLAAADQGLFVYQLDTLASSEHSVPVSPRQEPARLPPLGAPAARGSFNWLTASVLAYALLCVAYWGLA